MMPASILPDADSAAASIANQSPRNSGQNNGGSPKSSSRRGGGGGGRTVSAPWTQIVRSEMDIAAAGSSSVTPTAVVETAPSDEPAGERLDGGNGSITNAAGKKPVWSKLSNGTEAGPVMGAVSWPALSESAKGTPKSSSDSLKSLVDGSSGAQGTGTSSSSSNKEGNNDVSPNPDLTLTPPVTSRQKSMRRNGSGNSHTSGLPQQSAPSSPKVDPALHNSSKDQTQRTTFVSQSHNDHGHQQPRSSFRSRGGSHPRGDNSYHHNNYGSRRDHDRGNQDWNSNRNFNAQPHSVHRFIRPPPPPPPNAATAFISPPPMRPIGGPLPYPDFASPPMVYVGPPPEAFRGVPYVTSMPPNAMFFRPDPQLYSMIRDQIEYYFSAQNLIKDVFLRQNMNEEGWVSIRLIATFNKVISLTDNIHILLDALQSSSIVEVQEEMVRRRDDYDRWIIRPGQIPNVAGPLSPRSSNQDMLAAGIQGIALAIINHMGSEGGLGDGTSQVNTKAGSDHSSSGRS